MAVFELTNFDGQAIHVQHEADSIAALLRTLVANQFIIGEQVSSARGRGTSTAVPVGITFHSVAQVRLQPERAGSRKGEMIEHHALEDYRERG